MLSKERLEDIVDQIGALLVSEKHRPNHVQNLVRRACEESDEVAVADDRRRRRIHPPNKRPITYEELENIRLLSTYLPMSSPISDEEDRLRGALRDLLKLYDHLIDCLEERECYLAALTNDRDFETNLIETGLSRACLMIRNKKRQYEPPGTGNVINTAIRNVLEELVQKMAPYPAPPHERTIARCRRYEEVLNEIAAGRYNGEGAMRAATDALSDS